MYKLICLFLFSIAVNSVFAQDDAAQTKKSLQNNYISFLKEEGYSPTIDSDGDVKFKNEGDSYFLCPTSNAKRFCILRYLTDDDTKKYDKLLHSANKTMEEYYFIRITVGKYSNNDGCIVNFKIDNYLINNEDYKKVIYRFISVIQDAVKFFKADLADK